jgi:hypothetical protein
MLGRRIRYGTQKTKQTQLTCARAILLDLRAVVSFLKVLIVLFVCARDYLSDQHLFIKVCKEKSIPTHHFI